MPTRADVVITRLEQTERPVLETAAPPGVKTAILRAEHPPVHFYRYLYDVVGRPYHWVSRRSLSDEKLAEIIQDPQNALYVLLVDGVPGGMAELNMRAKAFELSFFGLTPENVGKRLGRYFLANIIETAWTLGAVRLVVETCTLDHPAALPLYRRLGFTVFAQKNGAVDLIEDGPAAT